MNNLKIGSRLMLGFGLLLALLCLMAGMAAYQMGTLSANTDYYADNLVPSYEAEHGIAIAMEEMRQLQYAHILANTAPEMEQLEKRIAQMHSTVEQGLTNYSQNLVSDAEDKRQLEDTRQAIAAYDAAWEQVQAISRQTITDPSKSAEAEALMTGTATKAFEAASAAITRWWAYNVQLGQQLRSTSERTHHNARWSLLGAVSLALVLGIGAAMAITRSIVRPVKRAVELASTVAQGDLTTRIEVSGKDELAELMQSLVRMNASLVDIVGQVRASSDNIATGSAQIAAGNADLSHRTESQASNLEQTAASMEEISGTVRSNAETADLARTMSREAAEAAAGGGALMNDVVATMKQITDASARIADIISVIDGIAFQTNILALNAAVEAARAGEQGRGFAVVAGEVRSLAKRCADAAKEIKDLIGRNVDTVEVGTRQVDEAGVSMQGIVNKVQQVSQMISEISNATTEQASGIGQIGQAVSQLDLMTQQNAALVEESAAAAASLRSQADRLTGVVGLFKLA